MDPNRARPTHQQLLPKFDEVQATLPSDLLARAVASLSDFLTWVGEHPPTASTSAHAYRNTDHILLGVLLERVTGRPFEVAIREHVLAPLDLDLTATEATSLPRTPPRIDRGEATAALGHVAAIRCRCDHARLSGAATRRRSIISSRRRRRSGGA